MIISEYQDATKSCSFPKLMTHPRSGNIYLVLREGQSIMVFAKKAHCEEEIGNLNLSETLVAALVDFNGTVTLCNE